MKYERLRPDEIDAIQAKVPVAVLPWGALEWHGYHAAIGLDGLKAAAFADAVADRIGAISLPPLYCGHQTMKPYAGFSHTIEVSAETLELLARDYVAQLAEEGFTVVVIISGHGNPDTSQRWNAARVRLPRPPESRCGSCPTARRSTTRSIPWTMRRNGRRACSGTWTRTSSTSPRSGPTWTWRPRASSALNPAETASPELGAAAFDEIVATIADRALELLAKQKAR